MTANFTDTIDGLMALKFRRKVGQEKLLYSLFGGMLDALHDVLYGGILNFALIVNYADIPDVIKFPVAGLSVVASFLRLAAYSAYENFDAKKPLGGLSVDNNALVFILLFMLRLNSWQVVVFSLALSYGNLVNFKLPFTKMFMRYYGAITYSVVTLVVWRMWLI